MNRIIQLIHDHKDDSSSYLDAMVEVSERHSIPLKEISIAVNRNRKFKEMFRVECVNAGLLEGSGP
jgi:hypothetical protein